MDEPEPPQAKKPLTRKDVLRLIEEHGGPEGLDLSQRDLRQAVLDQLDLHGANLTGAHLQGAHIHRANLEGADLQRADLHEAHLEGANLVEAKLQGATLEGARLKQAHVGWADLQGAVLQRASLDATHFIGANLQGADLRNGYLLGVDLWQADLRRAKMAGALLRDAKLEGANWGDYVLGDEIAGDFGGAASVYRTLKQRHTELGMYDIAGEFHYREMEARRKLGWKKRRLPYASAMYALRFLYGYGERPERVIGWVVAVILGFALGHWLSGTVERGFPDALYYSAVSFTALGYGAWAPEPQGWAGRFLGVGESLLGVFMMALFLVTFTRKMTR